ncbi:hypothetical protein B0H63DRAFT_463535 [Podospora didyma]|uniref:Uncharacterized protein n=1 Tax=Podospora didyma TaxID=330526 RepID=A0AAE0NX57_9PEZI|nr:hypothetical protein B0H63DRAFT_463535 [Podospora didyma]
MSHPNQEWETPFCDACSCTKISCMGFWWPCGVLQKTHNMLQGKEPSAWGGLCCGFTAINMFVPPCGCILSWKQRDKIKKEYHLEDSCVKDIFGNLCCICCAVVQQHNEVEKRIKKAGPNKEGYVRSNGMQARPQGY